jgi:steroid delta-isomerase-like uncharacterized protein
MPDLNATALADRNRANYLSAKEAFNRGDLDACIAFYAADHQIKSKPSPKGREHILAFFAGTRQAWPDVQIVVEHTVAENDWVMGRSVVTATHTTPVFGVAPTLQRIETTFWDLHRFDPAGLIAETWNLMDSTAIMAALGLLPGARR